MEIYIPQQVWKRPTEKLKKKKLSPHVFTGNESSPHAQPGSPAFSVLEIDITSSGQ